MNGLILAAGKGTRLMPITKEIPKCLVEVKGEKMIDQWIRHMRNANCKKIFINTHYMSEKVKNYIEKKGGTSEGIEILHETKLLGTAGTILENIEKFKNDDLLVAHCDNYYTGDIKKIKCAHLEREKGCLLTIMTFKTEDPKTCGIFKLNEEGKIIKYWEKNIYAEGNIANSAVYIIDTYFMKWMKETISCCFEFTNDVLPLVLDQTQTVQCDGILMDIGTPESLRKANTCHPWIKTRNAHRQCPLGWKGSISINMQWKISQPQANQQKQWARN